MTADQDLSVRLAYWRGIELECEALRANPGWRLEEALGQAYRSGQLITLADHERAVQAAVAKADKHLSDVLLTLTMQHAEAVRDAVAKAVEAEREACATTVDPAVFDYPSVYMGDPSRQALRLADTVAAAIRSRGVAG